MVYGIIGVSVRMNRAFVTVIPNSSFSALTVNCFGICSIGKRIYTRTCTPPIGGGMICAGPTQREETCNLTQQCPSTSILSSNWIDHIRF